MSILVNIAKNASSLIMSILEMLPPELMVSYILPKTPRLALLMLSETSHNVHDIVLNYCKHDRMRLRAVKEEMMQMRTPNKAIVSSFDSVLCFLYGALLKANFSEELHGSDGLHAAIWAHLGIEQIKLLRYHLWFDMRPVHSRVVEYLKTTAVSLHILAVFLYTFSALHDGYSTLTVSGLSAAVYEFVVRTQRFDLLQMCCPSTWQATFRDHHDYRAWIYTFCLVTTLGSTEAERCIMRHCGPSYLVDYNVRNVIPIISREDAIWNILAGSIRRGADLLRIRCLFAEAQEWAASGIWIALAYSVNDNDRRNKIIPSWLKDGLCSPAQLFDVFCMRGYASEAIFGQNVTPSTFALDELQWMHNECNLTLHHVQSSPCINDWINFRARVSTMAWQTAVFYALKDVYSWSIPFGSNHAKSAISIYGLATFEDANDKQVEKNTSKKSNAPPCVKCEARVKAEILFTPKTASGWSYRCPKCGNQTAMRKKR